MNNKSSNPERGIFFTISDDHKKSSTNRGASITRDPVIPLLEEDKNKALDREIVLDFNSRVIKAKDPNTGEFVEFNGKEIHNIFNNQGLSVNYIGDKINSISGITSDFKSIDIKDGVISIHGFDTVSQNNKIPISIHGEVVWKDIDEIFGSRTTVETSTTMNNNLLVVSLKRPTIVDGLNKENLTLTFPIREKDADYLKSIWKLTTDEIVSIKFPENTLFETSPFLYNEDDIFDKDRTHIVSMESFDRGNTWFCSVRTFSKEVKNNG